MPSASEGFDDWYIDRILDRFNADDGHGVYLLAKGWVGSGGGAMLVDPWLAYVVAALLQRQPRTAVRSLDLGLKHWVDRPADRSILHWVRAKVVCDWLNDPKSALADLSAATSETPTWLREWVERDVVACSAAAEASRRRKTIIDEAPGYRGLADPQVAERSDLVPPAGSVPKLWPLLLEQLDR